MIALDLYCGAYSEYLGRQAIEYINDIRFGKSSAKKAC